KSVLGCILAAQDLKDDVVEDDNRELFSMVIPKIGCLAAGQFAYLVQQLRSPGLGGFCFVSRILSGRSIYFYDARGGRYVPIQPPFLLTNYLHCCCFGRWTFCYGNWSVARWERIR